MILLAVVCFHALHRLLKQEVTNTELIAVTCNLSTPFVIPYIIRRNFEVLIYKYVGKNQNRNISFKYAPNISTPMPQCLNITNTSIGNMAKPSTRYFVWAPYNRGKTTEGIDVSSHGSSVYKKFSPFSHDAKHRIPVPGNEQMRSYSVEGIWQGLKLINGSTDLSLLSGRPVKRHGIPKGHLFGEETVDYQDAREKIYVPAYIYHAVNNALPTAKEGLEAMLMSGPVILYDVESNGDIHDLSKPYSHAALLVKLLNLLIKSPLPPFNAKRFTNLAQQVNATLDFRNKLDEDELQILDEVITFAYLFSEDELKETFALRAIQEGNLYNAGRLDKYLPKPKAAEPYLGLRR